MLGLRPIGSAPLAGGTLVAAVAAPVAGPYCTTLTHVYEAGDVRRRVHEAGTTRQHVHEAGDVLQQVPC